MLAGYKLLLADTAGVRETEHDIEAEGVRRARAWAADADLRLWVVDASASDGGWRFAEALTEPGDLLILNKSDLPQGADADAARAAGLETLETAVTEGGAEVVRQRLQARVVAALSAAEFPAATRLRHSERLSEARERVVSALATEEVELAAEDVRLAARALAQVTGQIGAEDVLDRVFSSFCIGK